MKELALVILTCSFLSSVELAGKNAKVFIFFVNGMGKHKAFCSCAQKIIYKVTLTVLQGFLQRVSQDEYIGCSLRPWEGLLSETCL